MIRLFVTAGLCLALAACGGGGGGGGGSSMPEPPSPPVNGPAWWNFGRDVQHTAQSAIGSQPLSRIVWQTAVDMTPPYLPNNVLHIHYGSPIVTTSNTVLVGVKVNRDSGFRIDARSGGNGALMWTAPSDYVLPAHDWTPSYNVALTQTNRVYWPGAGGRLFYRDNADDPNSVTQTVVFYGSAAYDAAPATYNATVIIDTPLTIDPRGNVYFGFLVTGATPLGLASGIARVAPDGSATYVSAVALTNSAVVNKPAMNAAPALSNDLSTVYAVFNNVPAADQNAWGIMVALDAQTLVAKSRVTLRDPATGAFAWVDDNASASPTIAPDGDVFYGVLESNTPAHNFRGWLLHYDATLATTKLPGSFGWDETVSIVPSSMVPQYATASPYLIVSKYNNYFGVGTGNGRNRMAILDPSQGEPDTITPGVAVMREALSVLGPTQQPGLPPGAVREWCVNTVAVDPATDSVLVNSEDGRLYRWHLPTNQLTQSVRFNNGTAESYTPTAIGADGKVYAINNAILFAVGQ